MLRQHSKVDSSSITGHINSLLLKTAERNTEFLETEALGRGAINSFGALESHRASLLRQITAAVFKC